MALTENGFNRPVALVTGAGSGIGRAICKLLAQRDYRLALVGRSEEKLNQTLREISSTDHDHIAVTADVAAPDQARAVVDRTLAHFDRLDVLINNAGSVESVPIEQTTQDLLDRMFAVNIFGPAHLIARAWPIFVKRHGGCVVNISSMSSADPFPGLSAYAAAKSALEGLTRAAHNEGHMYGIRCFAVAPGAVETDMLRTIASEDELPPSHALDPFHVAEVVVACIIGQHNNDIGRTIFVPSP